jgi:hypothetical protein
MDQFSVQMVIVDMNNNFITDIVRYEAIINDLNTGKSDEYIDGFIDKTAVDKKQYYRYRLNNAWFY